MLTRREGNQILIVILVMQSWNLHEVAVQFDGRRTPHKTAKFSGDRYCIVLYSPDLSYHNKGFTHIHERTEQLRPPTNEAPKEVGRVVTDSQKAQGGRFQGSCTMPSG